MRAVDLIRIKRDGGVLSREQITALVEGATDGSIPDYQLAAWLMAVVIRGMTEDETAALTDAMVGSGTRLDLADVAGPKVDKHSTGGVGDKTSLVLAPLVAACGAVVPMMSGRGLGHTGGTLDKLEAIPGFRTSVSIVELKAQLSRVGCAIVGQTAEIAPADKVLYALRDVTGTVESVPLITASIMSKKIAEGIDGLVLDVKTGAGAFMRRESDARALAQSLVATGTRAGVRTQALITGMDAPLGRAVGNALEVKESLEVLEGEGPADLRALSLELAARMLVMARVEETVERARGRAERALGSGAARERFAAMVAAQGGDTAALDRPERLPTAPSQALVPAPEDGVVQVVDAELVGRAAMALGAGRDRVDGLIDPAVGVLVLAKPGDVVHAGQPVMALHYRDAATLDAARRLAERAVRCGADAPTLGALIRSEVN